MPLIEVPASATTGELIRWAAQLFEAARIPRPTHDARVLLAHACGSDPGELHADEELIARQREMFIALAQRRARREPIEHLIGYATFRRLKLAVGPGVYVPRAETETLVELAIGEIRDQRANGHVTPILAADLCTGSAVIPLAVATEAGDVEMHAVEREPAAVAWARKNLDAYSVQLLRVGSCVGVVTADVSSVVAVEFAGLRGRCDIVTSNPPYIPESGQPRVPEVRLFDPKTAVYAGHDGMDVIRAVIAAGAGLLHSGGAIFIEHGPDQGEHYDSNESGQIGVPALLRASPHFAEVRDHTDTSGLPAVTTARRR